VPPHGTHNPSLTLIGHTQARAGEVAGGRLVFAVARDALFGLDAVVGRPKWRQAIGLDTPFFPVEVDAAVPALLAFDAGRNELLLLDRGDGEPVWRTPVGAAAAGPPLVTQGQIDLATTDGRLVRFALESGETLGAVSFPQPVVGPPVLVGERLVVFGDRATAYTLDLRSLEVRAVSFTGQAAGAIDVPPAVLGRLVVACENDRLDSSAVRAFTVDPQTGVVKQVASERIDGRTREPAVARGNVLFVPSSPERITAFSVSDDAGQPPLTKLAGVQIPGAKDVPVFLVPGPDGMLWAAGSALRKLRLTADGLKLLDGELAPGRHTQPPQQSGDSLFVARSLASSPAVYVSQADREAMTGSWRTVLGGSILAATAGDAVSLINDAGQATTVSAKDLEAGGFADTKPLPQRDEASPDPLRAATLADGRVAVWKGGKTPLLWLVRPGDRAGPPRPLAAELQCPPVALEGGLVLPEPGRLEWSSEAGSLVEAFLLPVGDAKPPAWKSLVGLDAERLAASDETGTLRVIRLRREPVPHLAEVASVKLDGGPVRPLAAAGDQILAASGRRLQLIDSAGLRPVAEATFDAPITGGPWFAEMTASVQTEPGDLIALDGEKLREKWRVKLDATAAGPPLAGGEGWVVASQTGTVFVLDGTGQETSRVFLGETLTGLVRIGQTIVALGIDGSLHPLPGEERRPDGTAAATEAGR
jgi:outer membrane protein assembly factor BamB